MRQDETDTKIIQFLQEDLPLVSNPFAQLAGELDLSEAELLLRMQRLQENGIIRRWGAILRHQKAGYGCNAMVAWKVDAEKADQAGAIMADRKEISHCYLREVPDDFHYQLFTMIHARDEKELLNTIGLLSNLTEIDDYAVLRSVREFKKVSMRYF